MRDPGASLGLKGPYLDLETKLQHLVFKLVKMTPKTGLKPSGLAWGEWSR